MMGRTLAANALAASLRALMEARRAAARRGPPGKKTVPVSSGNGSDYIGLDNVTCQKSASS